jgi:hypothetical protein
MSFEVLPSLEYDVFLPCSIYMLTICGRNRSKPCRSGTRRRGFDEVAFIGFRRRTAGMTSAPIRPTAIPAPMEDAELAAAEGVGDR